MIGKNVRAITSRYGVIIGLAVEKSNIEINGYFYYGIKPSENMGYRLIWVREDLLTPIETQLQMKGM